MALALVKYEDLSSLLVVTSKGTKGACHDGYSVASIPKSTSM
jgi:hypothetical protein